MIPQASNDFYRIVIEELPLIDVRAPKEFTKGAFLNSVNLPLMNDEERHLIGICYKEKGHNEAVKLGHRLICDHIQKERVDAWKTYLSQYPGSMLYCFKGGLRSQISQQWISEAISKDILRLEGGYKAFRNYLIKALEPTEQRSIPIVLSGYTGSGKTLMLSELTNSIDLEGIAHHRGSAFGKQITPQPNQINFENNLAYKLIQHSHQGYDYMIIEDEGRNVGSCFIPKSLAEYFNTGDLIIVEQDLEKRIRITLDEYVIKLQTQYIRAYGETQGLLEWCNYLDHSIQKIKNRLGLERYRRISDAFQSAYKEQHTTGTYTSHQNWIRILLKEYYDPMYEYQIQKKSHRIRFKGDYQEVKAYLKEHNH